MKKLFSVSLWDHVIASALGCVAISLLLLFTACDDSGSNSLNEVPSYATDSTTVEKVNELSSSSKKIESSVNEDKKTPKSSASEKNGDSSSGRGEASSSSEEIQNKCGSVTYNPKTQVCEKDKILEKCGEIGYDPQVQYCKGGKTPTDKPKCSDAEDALLYNPETQYCAAGVTPTSLSKCDKDESSLLYNPEDWYCFFGEIVSFAEAVIIAAKTGKVDVLKELAALGVPLGERDTGEEGFYAIHWAVVGGNYDAMMFLIKQGVEVNATCSKGCSPLDWAKSEGYIRLINALKKAGGKEFCKVSNGSRN